MLIDTHIHVGQFYDLYFAPSDIHNLMEQMHVGYYAVSSTSMCEEDYGKVLDELSKLTDLDGDKVLPVMWITPMGLQGNIAWFLESKIRWRMIKIHPFLNSHQWIKNSDLFNEVTDIAREMKLPLLIHTGNEKCCQSVMFESIITNSPDVDIILAHGRPIDQAIKLAQTYQNVYIDSAFMPLCDMNQIVDSGLSDKLLWGTDMCVPSYFDPNLDLATYYQNKVISFRNSCSEEAFNKVTWRNAAKLFDLEI